MKDISILKNEFGKFAFQVFKKKEIIYSSQYIYDDVFILDNNFETYLQQDFLLLTKDGMKGIFNAWTCNLIVPIEYMSIDMWQHHHTIVFKCFDVGGKYVLHDILGKKIINDRFQDLMWLGIYDFTQKYLYLFQNDTGVGVLSIEGNIIIPANENYLFKFHRAKDKDFLILEKTGLLLEQPTLYDVYSANGILLYQNINNYEFLGV